MTCSSSQSQYGVLTQAVCFLACIPNHLSPLLHCAISFALELDKLDFKPGSGTYQVCIFG